MVRIIEQISEWTGKVFTWLVVILTVIVLYEVFVRRVLNQPTIWAHDISTHIYGAHFIILIGYTLLYRSHVAVDIIYSQFSAKKQAIISIFTYACYFFPWVGIMIWQLILMTKTSWEIVEIQFGLFPIPLYPLKTVMTIAFVLLLLQGIATLSRSVTVLLPSKKVGEKS